jgi:23S rRNA pseudouridine1911/1915/1917 synthase
MTAYDFVVDKDGANVRLDVFLANSISGVTRSYIKNLVDGEKVKVNGKKKKAGYIIKENDRISAEVESRELSAAPEEIALEIVFEDEDLAVINKKQGMVVHPARGTLSGTLVNALLFNMKLSDVNGDKIRPGIVHRLDKDTSGLIVVAKNNVSHLSLGRQIAEKSAKRYYLALVDGIIKSDEGIIETAIGRSQKDRVKMAVTVDNKGKKAVTLYRVIERYGEFSFVEFELKTGRTHQIRVHAKYIGHPVTGDKVYGGSQRFKTQGQLLHAYKLVIAHPVTGKTIEFTAPLPEYFKKVLDSLKNDRG